jgi:hypothetical protein
MLNTFTNEEYTNMHFMYSFCNGSGRAAVVETSNIIHFAKFHIAKHLRMYAGL